MAASTFIFAFLVSHPTFICPAVSGASYRLDAQAGTKPPEGTTSAETQDGRQMYDRAIAQSDVPSWMFYLQLDLLQFLVPRCSLLWLPLSNILLTHDCGTLSPVLPINPHHRHLGPRLVSRLSLSLCTQPFQH